MMFAGHRRGLAFAMKNGDKVIVGGSVDVYERDGRYQMYAKEMGLPFGKTASFLPSRKRTLPERWLLRC